MRIIVECHYDLRPPAYWDGPDPLPVTLSLGEESVEVEASLGTESEVDFGAGGEPIEILVPVLRALVVRSGAELTSDEADTLAERPPDVFRVTDGSIGPLPSVLARNDKYARLVLRWLRVGVHDAELDVTAVAQGSKVTIIDSSGWILKQWDASLIRRVSFSDFRPEVGQAAVQEALERCMHDDDLPLAVELLLEADALYRRSDYRLSVLFSALALDEGLTLFLRQRIGAEQAISILLAADSKALSRWEKEDLKRQYCAGGPRKARMWLNKWLDETTLGKLIGAGEDLQLETDLQKGIFGQIREVKKLRDKIVHPRSSALLHLHQADANNARRLARRFLRLSGHQLPMRP